MNDDADRDGDDLAERLLLDTIGSLRKLASASLNDPSLSIWSQGRVLHGNILIESHAESLIDLIHEISTQEKKPYTSQSIFGAINSLLIGAFKIGQVSSPSLDQKHHENLTRTEAAREASAMASGRQKRIHIISEYLHNNPNVSGSVKRMLGPINMMLKADGQDEIEEWSLRRDLKYLKKHERNGNKEWSISDAFRPADD